MARKTETKVLTKTIDLVVNCSLKWRRKQEGGARGGGREEQIEL